ncbi:MAG: hypothetical protein IJ735_01165 [Clostridia bacterium]|nr:hypothetical protein [Clostridia bacterium]
MLRERKQYSNKEPDGYYSMFSGAIDYDLLYEKEEHFRDAMNRLYGELSGYDPLEVFPAGEYAYPQYSLCVTAQAVLTSEEEEIEYLSSASFLYSYCAILSNIQSAPDVGYYSEDYGVELKSFWGYDTESGLIYKQKDDHTSRAYTASLWLKTIFVYKDVAYCIYLPRIYTRVFYGDPLDTEKMSSQELHGGACRLGVKNSRLAVPYIPAVSRALFDIFFASEIEALNEAAEA